MKAGEGEQSQPVHVSSLDEPVAFALPLKMMVKDGKGPSCLHPLTPCPAFSKGLPPTPACTPHSKRSHSSSVVGIQILQFLLGQTFCSLSCRFVDGKISCLVGDKKEGGCVARDLGFSVLSLNMKSFELCVLFEICTNPFSLLNSYFLGHW